MINSIDCLENGKASSKYWKRLESVMKMVFLELYGRHFDM